nr:maleylpyruvate isomerase N-terminal domain-containing protein [Actinoplanes friuliensis]
MGVEEWALPTRCSPWTVAGLLGHVVTVIGWIPGMLGGEAPLSADVSARAYYRADKRFSPESNSVRIALGIERAGSGGPALAREFLALQERVVGLCRLESPDRVVRTRHGDAMLLTDFLVTRIVEVGLHGVDLADALGREPWLTPAAAAVLKDLYGTGEVVGMDDVTLLKMLSGRLPASGIDLAGSNPLTLG